MILRSFRGLALLATLAGTGIAARAQEEKPEQRRAIAVLTKLGTEFTRDDSRPGKPVTEISLAASPRVTDAALLHVGAFPELEVLKISSDRVKGPGLAYLQPLKHLKVLMLSLT